MGYTVSNMTIYCLLSILFYCLFSKVYHGPFSKKKNQVAIGVWVCMWVLSSVPLISVSNLKSKMEIPPMVFDLFVVVQDCFAYS